MLVRRFGNPAVSVPLVCRIAFEEVIFMAVHEKSVVVNAPAHKVFMMWSNFENFPNYMSHVKEVKMLDGDRSHWKGTVAGIDEEWDAKTTKMDEDRAIAWDSISGFENSGEVRFDPVDGGTRVTVRFEYTPPAGPLGWAAEEIYVGSEFEQDLQEDLEKFKAMVESA